MGGTPEVENIVNVWIHSVLKLKLFEVDVF